MDAKLLLAAAILAAPALAADEPPKAALSPGEIVAAAPVAEWIAITPDDLLVMDLAADRDGTPRRVVIQLIPPFSQPWVANIRTLAKAHWWDGLAIVRAQDNYVVQWGDPDAEDIAKARRLPNGLMATSERHYAVRTNIDNRFDRALKRVRVSELLCQFGGICDQRPEAEDNYSDATDYAVSLPIAGNFARQDDGYREGLPSVEQLKRATAANLKAEAVSANASRVDIMWPVHCYGTVGVGRGMSPDAGSGAELYTVIGHAPRHLDRNIAVVGRVIEGIEHLSTLPRGTEALGFYKTPDERTPIVSIRLGSEVAGLPTYEYLSTEGETFARYVDARANRRDPFFIVPAGGADVCNIPVPVRRVPTASAPGG